VTKPFRIGLLSREHAAELVLLRKQCYRLSTSFSWFDEAALEWTAVDDASVVVGVFDGQAGLVATVRASIRADRPSVEAILAYATHNVPDRFPALVGSRSATNPAFTRHGLAAAMRWVLVGHAMRLRLGSITGVVYDDAPRVRSMLAQGYEFYTPPHHWDAEATLVANPIIISMPASAFAQAKALIESQAAQSLAACSVDDAAITQAFDQHAAQWARGANTP
jgi:hypothetical protein